MGGGGGVEGSVIVEGVREGSWREGGGGRDEMCRKELFEERANA